MRAAVRTRYGGPDEVRVVEVDEPTPGESELLVRVHATTVNRTDSAYLAGTPGIMRTSTGLRRPKRTILGTEFAGVVQERGSEATAFAAGDRVFGYVEGRFGAHAELMTVPATGLVTTIPEGWSFEEAAPATEGWHYAHAFLRVAGTRAGHDVLVHGATGAIGSAAVQLSHHAGATVTAVCGPDHLDLVRGLGADRVVDHTAVDFTADEQRYDAVFDAVGKSTFGRCRRLLKPRGVYVSSELGPKAQNPFLALGTPLLRGRTVRFPYPRFDRTMLAELRGMLEAGTYRPLVDRTYPLGEIVEAYRYVQTGRKVGSVVVTVMPPGAP